MARKFYHNIVQLVILTEDTPLDAHGFPTLTDIEYEINNGDSVGGELKLHSIEITPQQAANELYKVGSEPGFFQLDDDGNDLNEGE